MSDVVPESPHSVAASGSRSREPRLYSILGAPSSLPGAEHEQNDTRWRCLVGMVQHRMADDSQPVARGQASDGGLTAQSFSEKWLEPWQPSAEAQESLQHSSVFTTINYDVNAPSFGIGGANGANLGMHIAWWKYVLLRNAFVPLIARLVNIVLIACTLAVGIRLRIELNAVGRPNAVGISPLLTIIFSPPSILHAFFQIWVEYMTRPIGLWGLSPKLWYAAVEIVFTCLWAALLSLAFDNYFTSSIACKAEMSPFFPLIKEMVERLGYIPHKDRVCDLQIALICFCMVSVFDYVLVFMVTLFRIFYRVTPQL